MSRKRVRNMEEFASLSGLSRPTVSKYFHDPASVRPTTRARIEEALDRYEFRPNVYAMNQNRKLTKSVGIVVPLLADPYFAEISRKLEQRCLEAGYRPTLFSSHGDPAHETEVLDGLVSLKPAGVLLAPLGRASDADAIRSFCEEVPTVIFDSSLDEVGLGFIGSDNVQFTTHITDYLCRTAAPPCFFEMKTPANPNRSEERRVGKEC